ncbi:MAG: 2-oxo-4-hydroxy-4-carboxy-5-ureidoimidazoline decarboxylase [Polaromonas sp.]|uniref:2-oxo-4-hydroxy-4-carboxy-5-ureidoimidazoline decarboxylase n=1 Tax=Polaromonas sp. TaxID=1869339 RepID=UPI0025D9BABE|nr:2-oxo-4-hydroxy-4-carboxy-5-ureidoimidazoline decarboxylase [Polaromonas sp.]MBI2724633.1 2-oxo-4-hydroxy-4-carboxy-5-ureidoimidazoline decarboxylase [Polaromonas sp.]
MTTRSSLENLNTCTPEVFCSALADIWEYAPWVANGIVGQRPFATVEALHKAMVAVVAGLDEPARLAFYAGHPELAGEDARRGTMTDASIAEQGTLSLAQLDTQEAERWSDLNRAYRARFGFPFILCIRRHTRQSALQAFNQRLAHDRDTELSITLDEIAAITRLRLDRLVSDASDVSHAASHGEPIPS